MGRLISEAVRRARVTSFPSKYYQYGMLERCSLSLSIQAKVLLFVAVQYTSSPKVCSPKIPHWERASLRPPLRSMQQRRLLFLLFALITLPLKFYNHFLSFRRYMYAETTKTTRSKTSRDVAYASASGGLRSLPSRDSASTSGGLIYLPSRDAASASSGMRQTVP